MLQIFTARSVAFLARDLVLFAAAAAPMGIWVLAHVYGHGSFSVGRLLANAVRFAVHSALLLPYHAWWSTHHHVVKNITTDFNYVPPTRAEYGELLLQGRARQIDIDFDLGNNYHNRHHHAVLVEEGSAVVLLCITLQFLSVDRGTP
ncbi:hypothetical protein DL771_003511 [Monosporascus sp. 5C6A]|nr:hypothetical protein DL771_003511 [Monosporascus sp. 5C6A]